MSLGRLGPYELIDKLPSGGNADVFVGAREGSSDVAIKRLRAPSGSEPWRRFVQEIRVVGALGVRPTPLCSRKAGEQVPPREASSRRRFCLSVRLAACQGLEDAGPVTVWGGVGGLGRCAVAHA